MSRRKTATLIPITCEPPGEDVDRVIEFIRAKAARGELSALTVAYVTREGATGHDYSRLHSVGSMLGALALAQAAITYRTVKGWEE